MPGNMDCGVCPLPKPGVKDIFHQRKVKRMDKLPKHFVKLKERFGPVIEQMNSVGDTIAKAGPIDEKTGQLIQLAAAAAQRSEGAVHSHARRAVKAGASPDEVRHALVLLIPTVGFPTVAAALAWVDDILDD